MRTVLPFLFFLMCFTAGASDYGDRLIAYYGFEITPYGSNYHWSWRNPATGSRIYHQWSGTLSKDPEALQERPVLVNFYSSDGRALFWVHVPTYNDYAGYTEEGLLSNRPTFGSAKSPMSEAFMSQHGLIPFHPDEYNPPTPPTPGGDGEDGEEPSIGGYDYRSRLDMANRYLSVIAASLCMFMGLFAWRLVVLAKSQRDL